MAESHLRELGDEQPRYHLVVLDDAGDLLTWAEGGTGFVFGLAVLGARYGRRIAAWPAGPGEPEWLGSKQAANIARRWLGLEERQ